MEFRALFKDKKFNIVFSVILGLFIASLFKPVCRGTSCYNYRPPPVAEIESTVYNIGDKCYKFKTRDVACPMYGAVEAYEDCTG